MPRGPSGSHLLLVLLCGHWRLRQSHTWEEGPHDTVTECPQITPVTCTSGAHDDNHTVCPEAGSQLLSPEQPRELCLLGFFSAATSLFGDLPGPMLMSPLHTQACVGLSSICHFPLGLFISYTEVRWRGDHRLGWVVWGGGGPALPTLSLPPFHTHHSSLSRPKIAPPPRPSLGPIPWVWLEMPKLWSQASTCWIPESLVGWAEARQSPHFLLSLWAVQGGWGTNQGRTNKVPTWPVVAIHTPHFLTARCVPAPATSPC